MFALGLRVRVFVAFAVLVLSAGAADAQSPVDREISAPRRGVAFLACDVGDSTSAAEVLDFVESCRIDFVVIDFAWITGVWPQTKMAGLSAVCEQLRRKNVRVAAMYRPRALRPEDARIHFAQDADGKIATNHLHLCLAHDDSQTWGAQWGTRILTAIPSVDTIIIYNLLSVCQCPDCREKGPALATQFLKRCRSEWSRVRPGLRVGHVGVGDEYVDAVDFFCPFVGVNHDRGQEQTPLEFPGQRLGQFRTAHADKWMAPLLKTCWMNETHNSTTDIVETLGNCRQNKTGFLLWYYEWVLHSQDRTYDAKTIVESLGGDWNRLGKYYARKPGGESTQPQAPAVVDVTKALEVFRANPDAGGTDLIAAGEAAVDGVVNILKDRAAPSRTRYLAANVLGEIKSKKAVRPLLAALKDQDFNVRRCSAEALGRIGDLSAKPALEKVARTDPFAFRDPKARKPQYMVRDSARRALLMLTKGPAAIEEAGLRKERERFLDDASQPPPFAPPLKLRRLPWPFPGEMKEQNIWNNYQQATDTYVHGGLDFLHPAGTEVQAVEDGYVAVIATNYPEWKTHFFFIVATQKGGNEGWCYVHLDKDTYTFKEGDRIRKGQVLGKLVDFYVGKNKGGDHLHLHYVRFHKVADGKVEVESLIDPALFFDWKDDAAPQIAEPLRFVRKGTLDEFAKGEDDKVVVSGKVEIIAVISDSAYEGQMCHWMTPIVTLEIQGDDTQPWRKLVLDQRGAVAEGKKMAASALYLTYNEGEKWRRDLPPSGGVHFVKVTSSDGDGVIEPNDKVQAWNTAERDSTGKPRFPDGLYTVTVRAWDLKENQATRTATVRVANKK
jgi:murein DD-endopeptidase MepM/ murein hydrolase activator NlpD